MNNEIYLKDNEAFYLHPSELILLSTRELLILPDNLIGWLDSRFSSACLGMIHVTPHRIDPE